MDIKDYTDDERVMLVKKWAPSLKDYTSDSAINNGAIFLEHTEALNPGLEDDERLFEIAADTFEKIYDELHNVVGIQSNKMEGKKTLLWNLFLKGVKPAEEGGMSEVEMVIESKETEIDHITTKMKIDDKQLETSKGDFDLKKEVEDTFAFEFAGKLSEEVLGTIVELAKKNEISEYTYDCNVPENLEKAYTHIIENSFEIAKSTRRGAGTITLASPKCTVMLQSIPDFRPNPVSQSHLFSFMADVGSINSHVIKRALRLSEKEDCFITCYKGENEADAGIKLALVGLQRVEDGFAIYYKVYQDAPLTEKYYRMTKVEFNV
jgi:hypothetical protein